MGTNRAASCKMLFEKNYFAALLRQEREREIHAYPLLTPSLPHSHPWVGVCLVGTHKDPESSIFSRDPEEESALSKRSDQEDSRLPHLGDRPFPICGSPNFEKSCTAPAPPFVLQALSGLSAASLSLCGWEDKHGFPFPVANKIPAILPLPTKDEE